MFRGKNYINGEWFFCSDNVFNAINPSTEEIYGIFPYSSQYQIDHAVKSARNTFESWKLQSRVKRAEYFDKLAQLIKRDHNKLRDAVSIETGKSLNESHAEVIEMLHMCQVVVASGRQSCGKIYSSELPTKDCYVIHKPKGVVLVISPWNFPMLGAFWCAAPAIVEGNTVIHKPSELTPMVNQMIAELYEEAGFPAGVFNLVHGGGAQGAALVRSNVDVILFTGSSEVGQDIRKHCAETFTKTCSIECGSKSATMVFADGDMSLAVSATIASSFKLSGQRCVSSSRIIIERSIFEEFKKRFVLRASQLLVGDPFGDGTWNPDYGPVISLEQMNKIIDFNQQVIEDKDATVLLNQSYESTKGYFLNPFVYSCEWSNKPFLKQEVFGPHVALIPFDNIDDAIRIYNDSEYGLALAAITDDFRKHRKIAQECVTGMLYINGGSISAESHLPFGGVNKSGNFTKSAAGTYKSVTYEMTITTNYEEGNINWPQGLK